MDKGTYERAEYVLVTALNGPQTEHKFQYLVCVSCDIIQVNAQSATDTPSSMDIICPPLQQSCACVYDG
jgi:hypothetical protein